jgi:thiol-disulfide isomerase/thioredoxin
VKLSKTLYFGTTWCSPCKMMKPVVAKLMEEGHDFEYLDIDDNAELVNKHQITSVPTFIKLKHGIEVNRHVGVIPETKLREFLQ